MKPGDVRRIHGSALTSSQITVILDVQPVRHMQWPLYKVCQAQSGVGYIPARISHLVVTKVLLSCSYA